MAVLYIGILLNKCEMKGRKKRELQYDLKMCVCVCAPGINGCFVVLNLVVSCFTLCEKHGAVAKKTKQNKKHSQNKTYRGDSDTGSVLQEGGAESWMTLVYNSM